ncbi:MAG: kinase/pyrophosphorylase [Clostridiales bacterium]|jgi:regulator of PEP synthase PpsR (kinase-PPPase family)|nr:kinase/pyrophosphorylase [Clostridiales bacterium]
MDEKSVIYVISDSIGETADQVTRAAIAQYGVMAADIRRIPYVSEKETIEELINEAKKHNSIIVYTLVIPELKEYFEKEAKKQGLVIVDIMGPVIEAISHITKTKPTYTPGIIRQLDEEYFKKVEAIEFAVKYDDGKDPKGVKKADIVIIGVSRTSKTPLSMYLANKNLKVANIPLVPEVEPPKELYEISSKRVFGLTSSPHKLNVIRQERLKALGLSFEANYANMDRILQELEYAENIMKKIGCPIIDVTNKAIEETASIILKIMKEDN